MHFVGHCLQLSDSSGTSWSKGHCPSGLQLKSSSLLVIQLFVLCKRDVLGKLAKGASAPQRLYGLDRGLVHRGWGGPHDAGNYNSRPSETGFFMSQGGSWDTDYGHFFLSWYSGMLLQHAQRILTATMRALDRHGVPRKFKGSQLVSCCPLP